MDCKSILSVAVASSFLMAACGGSSSEESEQSQTSEDTEQVIAVEGASPEVPAGLNLSVQNVSEGATRGIQDFEVEGDVYYFLEPNQLAVFDAAAGGWQTADLGGLTNLNRIELRDGAVYMAEIPEGSSTPSLGVSRDRGQTWEWTPLEGLPTAEDGLNRLEILTMAGNQFLIAQSFNVGDDWDRLYKLDGFTATEIEPPVDASPDGSITWDGEVLRAYDDATNDAAYTVDGVNWGSDERDGRPEWELGHRPTILNGLEHSYDKQDDDRYLLTTVVDGEDVPIEGSPSFEKYPDLIGTSVALFLVTDESAGAEVSYSTDGVTWVPIELNYSSRTKIDVYVGENSALVLDTPDIIRPTEAAYIAVE